MESCQTSCRGPEHYSGMDILRGFAAFVIVLIHTPALPSDALKPLLLDVLPPANAVFAIMAGFFMLEGLWKRADARVWFKSRLNRLIVPYLLWTVIYVLLNLAFDALSKKSSNFSVADWRVWLGVLFCGGGGRATVVFAGLVLCPMHFISGMDCGSETIQ